MNLQGFLQNAALAQQSARAEQNRKAVLKIHAQLQAQEERAKTQRHLKQQMFKWRQLVQTALALENPLQRCLALIELKDREGWLDISAVDDLVDKQWHAESQALLSKGLSNLSKDIDEDTFDTVLSVRKALLSLENIAATLIEYDNKLERKKLKSSGIRKWNEMLELLYHALKEAERCLSHASKEVLELLPLEKSIESTRAGIIDPVSIDRFTFKCLILVAKADGNIEKSEIKLLKKSGKQFRLTDEDIGIYINETDSIQKADFVGNQQAGERILRDLYQCASVDGSVDPTEEAKIYEIGQEIGVSVETLNDIFGRVGDDSPDGPLGEKDEMKVIVQEISEAAEIPDDNFVRERAAQEIGLIDSEKVIKLFLDQITDPAKSKSDIQLRAAIPADELKKISSSCSMVSSENPLILISPNLFGFKKDRFLLTNHAFYKYVHVGKQCERLTINGILSFKQGKIGMGKIKAQDGATVKTPTDMNGTFQALIESINASLVNC